MIKIQIILKHFSHLFIYFYSEEDLDNKVKLILDNYDDYKIIAENAKNKVMNNYLISNLVDFILENKK